jgi:hypothetical protein
MSNEIPPRAGAARLLIAAQPQPTQQRMPPGLNIRLLPQRQPSPPRQLLDRLRYERHEIEVGE